MQSCRLLRSPQAHTMTLATLQRCLHAAGTAVAGAALCAHRWASTCSGHGHVLQNSRELSPRHFGLRRLLQRLLAVAEPCRTTEPHHSQCWNLVS